MRRIRYSCSLLSLVAMHWSPLAWADDLADLKKLVAQQATIISSLQRRLEAVESKQAPVRVEAARQAKGPVNLTYDEIEELPTNTTPSAVSSAAVSAKDPVLDKQWFNRFDISGFSAMGVAGTGKKASKPNFGFTNFATSIFFNAAITDSISYFLETFVVPENREAQDYFSRGESYLHLRNLASFMDLNLKVGRVDVPFGEEYLKQDACDNPLVSHSAGWPWGWDEGVVAYGTVHQVGWIAALLDGAIQRGFDDNKDKSVVLKLYGNPTDRLKLSGSFQRNGGAGISSEWLNGGFITPVGYQLGEMPPLSTRGASPSKRVDSILYELDAQYTWPQGHHLYVNVGQVFVQDAAKSFDRTLTYGSMENLVNLSDKLYAVLRVSTLGTFDHNKGYRLDGWTFNHSGNTFGYDATFLSRFSFGPGFRLNRSTTLKLEYTVDQVGTLRDSPLPTQRRNMNLLAAQAVVKF